MDDPIEVIKYNGFDIEIFDNEQGCIYNIHKNGIFQYSGGSENVNDCIFNAQYRIDLNKFN